MKTQNKTNLVLLILLALILTLACSLDEEAETENTNKDKVVAADTKDDEKTTDESDQSDEESDKNDESETKNGPTTVKFSKGKTSRTYKKSIKSGESHTYYLSASSGQAMFIEIDSDRENAGFTVYNPAGEELSGADETTDVREFDEDLENSGRYKIVVTSDRNVDYDITFEVSAKSNDLTPEEASGGANKTVKFGRGKSSATYSNSVIRGDRDTYNLKASAGQFMTVTITDGADNAGFQIIAPNGKELVLDDTNWREELPASGNYKIIVGAGRGNATYTIKFKVEQSPIDH